MSEEKELTAEEAARAIADVRRQQVPAARAAAPPWRVFAAFAAIFAVVEASDDFVPVGASSWRLLIEIGLLVLFGGCVVLTRRGASLFGIQALWAYRVGAPVRRVLVGVPPIAVRLSAEHLDVPYSHVLGGVGMGLTLALFGRKGFLWALPRPATR